MPPAPSPRIYLLTGAACISLSPILTKLTEVPGLTSAFYRVTLAMVVLLPVVLYKKHYKLSPGKIGMALLCGLFFAMDLACWNMSLMISNTAVATVLGNLAPVWTGLLLLIFRNQRPSAYYWVGVGITLCGVIYMIGWSRIIHFNLTAGNLLALAASFFYAIYIVITRLTRSGISTMTFMFYSMLGYLLFSFLFAWLAGAPLSGFSSRSWLMLVLLAMVPQLLGWLCVNHALGHLASTEVSMVLLGQIVIASLLATVVFDEILSLAQILGGLIVVLGIAVTYLNRGFLKSVLE
ncbi:MAG TPA: DMT family transporter [Saprospiraceae bacterium]|nr:DMT family transporter [Saprospiraceae bacterium]